MELIDYLLSNLYGSHFIGWIVAISLWELIWKGFALYRAGKKQQPVWFVLILILNTIGILPIIYLIISREKKIIVKRSKKKK
jgi:hypothetical protein